MHRYVPFLLLTGCAQNLDMGSMIVDEPTTATQAVHEVCPAGATTFGIDVSYYQGNIDWNAAAADGVAFAVIRVSDGTGFLDPKFAQNWEGARNAGVLRGAYQFFRSDDDPIAQAQLLLDQMGPLEANDLPPVIDVESTDGVGNATRIDRIRAWLDHVEAAVGAKPIIYTGGYFWQDNVGTDEFNDHPLWHAGYTGGDCPSTIANQWPDWTIWQYSSSGSVSGIGGDVDVNRFNGDFNQLLDLTVGERVPCEALPAEGGVLSEDGPCFTGGGPRQYLRFVTDAGEGGNLIWTHTTDAENEDNYAEWRAILSDGGRYRIEAYTDAAYAQSAQSRYVVTHDGIEEAFVVDQTATNGWNLVAELDLFSETIVHLSDNTGEPLSGNTQQVYDALRLVRVEVEAGEGEGETGEGEGETGEGEGETGEGEGETGEGEGEGEAEQQQDVVLPPSVAPPKGCAATPTSPVLLLALFVLLRRRSR
jgi:GH25 family lysozyme M1 (1,4-beta-N-acetylmuramidase)